VIAGVIVVCDRDLDLLLGSWSHTFKSQHSELGQNSWLQLLQVL